jgi:cyclopropane-fatty-acyl-phospholipid synthase
MRLSDLAANARARLAAVLLAPFLALVLQPLTKLIEALTYRNLLPDCALRFIIRTLLGVRLNSMPSSLAARTRAKMAFVEGLKRMPVAVQQQDANEQHYELPTPYFLLALGRHLKYSCCLYDGDAGATDEGPVAAARAQAQLRRLPASRAAEELSRAERAMLALTCARADMADGQRILELGCGWGSLTLFMAAAFPGSTITAVSNSRTQRRHIERQALERGLKNVTVLTADMAGFEVSFGVLVGARVRADTSLVLQKTGKGQNARCAKTDAQTPVPHHPKKTPKNPPNHQTKKPPHGDNAYDRVVSVEMLEHMKNYDVLFSRIARWLKPGKGKFFCHVFAHRDQPYHFEARDETDWMARHFFSGGTMPSLDLFLHFQQPGLKIADVWWVNGKHYSRTLEAWLARHDQAKRGVMGIFEETYGRGEALRWFVMWRIFYLACSELFAYRGGDVWGVAHYLFEKPAVGGDDEGEEEAGEGEEQGARQPSRLAAGLRAAAARVMG